MKLFKKPFTFEPSPRTRRLALKSIYWIGWITVFQGALLASIGIADFWGDVDHPIRTSLKPILLGTGVSSLGRLCSDSAMFPITYLHQNGELPTQEQAIGRLRRQPFIYIAIITFIIVLILF